MPKCPESLHCSEQGDEFVKDLLPPRLAWLADETIDPQSDTPEYASDVLRPFKVNLSEGQRKEIYLRLRHQLIKIEELSRHGDHKQLEAEKRKYLKQISILERAYKYLDGIDDVTISGKPLRTTQKIAAFGFRDFIQANLFEEKLIGHIVQPVGAGKTNIAVMLNEMLKGRTVFIAYSHGENILKSFREHQDSVHPVAQKSVGQCFGKQMETDSDIMVANFASAHKWLPSIDWNSVDLVVVDEADVNALTENRRQLLEDLSEKYGIPIAGMSATEEQGSGKQLQDAFPEEICRLGMPDGLVKCLELGIVPQMKFSDLYLDLEMLVDKEKIKRLDDIPNESVDEFIRSSNWIQLIFENYLSRYRDGDKLKPGLLILRDNLLADVCIEKAKKMGIRAVSYTGELSLKEREQKQKDLAEGKIDMLVGSRLLGRGLHIPEVEVVYNSTITWSPQVFWQADGRGATIDNNNPDKTSHIIAVLPRTMNDKVSGTPLPPEFRPYSHSTFFDPLYFEGAEDRLIDFNNEFSILKRRTSVERNTYYEYDLGGVETIRSIREVHDLIRRLKNKPADFISKGRMMARYIDSLSDEKNLSIGLLRHLINAPMFELREEAEANEKMKLKCESYTKAGNEPNDIQDSDSSGCDRYLELLCESAPVINREEEAKLMQMAEAGDEQARKIIIHAYLPLMYSIAKKMHVDGFDLSDLVSSAAEGVIKLFSDLKKRKGGFSGYVAVKSFRQIQCLIANESRDVRLPYNFYYDCSKLENMRARIQNQLMHEPVAETIVTDEDMQDELQIDPDHRKEHNRCRDKEHAVWVSRLHKKITDYLEQSGYYTYLERGRVSRDYFGAIYRHKYNDEKIGSNRSGSRYISPFRLARTLRISLDDMEYVLYQKKNAIECMHRIAYVSSRLALADRTRRRIFNEYKSGERPTVEQVAELCGIKLENKVEGQRCNKWVMHNSQEVSLDESRHKADHANVDPDPSPLDNVILLNLPGQTRRVIKTLTPREERVLRLRFGIGEKSDHTLNEVAEDFGLNRERIRQIESKALRKLRHSSRSKHLKSFIED